MGHHLPNTVLPATRHRWTRPTQLQQERRVLDLPTTEGWKAELTQVVGYIPRWFTRPHTVTHPSTNRARRRVITAILTNTLQLSHVTTQNRIFFISASLNWVTRDASNIYGPLRIISRLSLEIRLSYLLCSSWGGSDLQGIKVSLPLLY